MSMKANLKSSLIMLVFVLVVVSPAMGRIIYVDEHASGRNDGSTWADAYNYLQDALADASSGDEIWVAEGVYRPDQGRGITPGDRYATFKLKNDVAIYGGFRPIASKFDDRNPSVYQTILTGDLKDNDVEVNEPVELLGDPCRADNCYHVVMSEDANEKTILDGFFVTGGNADGSPPNSNGAGMFNERGKPKVINCAFYLNSAVGSGGAMCNRRSGSTVTNCVFSENSASGYAGGMRNEYASATVTKCIFSGNVAVEHCGGGMSNVESSNVIVADCMFSGNAARLGGGMSNHHSSAVVINCTFNGNFGLGIHGHGGGMHNCYQSNPTLTNCAFSGNWARGGGGMFNNEGSPVLTNCSFLGNKATYGGGGAMRNGRSKPLLVNCTISGNYALSRGGAISNTHKSSPTLINCILWDNTIGDGALVETQIPRDGPVSYCCIQDTDPDDDKVYLGTGNIDDDPWFVSPGYWADANDLNVPVKPDDDNAVWVEGDYHLLPNSPCVDAGNNKKVPSSVTVDLDEDPRLIDGDGDGIATADIGAYEYELR
ncbi:MAG: right-handed parallel beta-helix repeat-containing protein [Planctomycetota bacterium]|jgi:hypothetical protein